MGLDLWQEATISQGMIGIGPQNGAIFRDADEFRRTTNISGAPGFESTTVDTFQLIGQGQAPDLLVHITTHLTYAPDQGFTAQVTNVSRECR